MTNLSAGGPYWLTGSNVIVAVSGEAVTNVVGKHEEKWIPTPLICPFIYPDGHACGATNPYPAKCETNNVAPDTYTYDWTLGANPKVPGSGKSFSATNSVSTPGPYTLTANFTGTRKDCDLCTCLASGSTNCNVYKIEIVVEIEDPKPNGVRSGLNLETIKFILNGNQIDNDKLTIKVEESEWLDGPIECKVKVYYAPSLDELVVSPLVNQVTVDIEDNVKNVMDQQVKTFIFNSASGY